MLVKSTVSDTPASPQIKTVKDSRKKSLLQDYLLLFSNYQSVKDRSSIERRNYDQINITY